MKTFFSATCHLERHVRFVLVVCTLLFASATAHAQSVTADLLFDQGRALMNERRFAEAARRFEESHRIDPSPGTLLNLAQCYDELGRTATAWSTFRAAASLAASEGQADREDYALRRMQELQGLLATVTVTVPEHARVPGLSVTLAGVRLPEALWGTPVPVDPGTIPLRVEAKDKEPSRHELQIAPTEDVDFVVPVLDHTAKRIVVTRPASTVVAAPSEPEREQTPGRGQRMLGWALTGAGVIGTGVGVVLYARGQSSIEDANCPDRRCVIGDSNPSLYEDGRRDERLGVGAFVAGAVAATTGVVLVLTAPSAPERAGLVVRGSPSQASLSLHGSF